MKPTLLSFIFLLTMGTMANAQFSLLPQLGFEQARTTLGYNARSASGIHANLRAALKADYRFKGKHGAFVSVGTSPAPVNFSFGNDGTLAQETPSVSSALRFRFESGYQYTSKPIQFKKTQAAKPKAAAATVQTNTYQRKSCGSTASTYRSHCSGSKSIAKTAPVNKALNMRLQPSLAFAYVAAGEDGVQQQANGFAYDANNWSTAVVPAMGFEFGKGDNRLFTLTVFYTKPIGMNSEAITSVANTKPVITTMNPKAATWGLKAGVPISLSKKPAPKVVAIKEVKPATYNKCAKRYGSWQ